jgi:hypothetical protein
MHRMDLLARRDGRALCVRKDVAVFRIAIRSAGAVAALATLVSLTGCGPVLMGAAAILGTERVSASALSAHVASLDTVYQANPALQSRVSYKPADMPQVVLTFLVQLHALDAVAQENGVQVTPAEAQRAFAAEIAGAGQQLGSVITPDQFAMLIGLPPTLEGQFARAVAEAAKLEAQFAGAAGVSSLSAAQQQQAQARLNAEMSAASTRLGFKVNPQYGQLDPANVRVGPVQNPLVKAAALGPAQQPAA